MSTRKYSLIVIACSVLALFMVAAAQRPGTTKQLKPSTDSTITVKEVYQFNQWLKDNASMSQYSKLTPEATLYELLNWKLKMIAQAKKQLADTTKPKK